MAKEPPDPRVIVAAINSANDGVVITDPNQDDNPIVFVNRAFEKLTGYKKEEIIGKNCRFLQADDRDQKGLAVVRRALKEQRECRVELRNYHKDGTLFYQSDALKAPRFSHGDESATQLN